MQQQRKRQKHQKHQKQLGAALMGSDSGHGALAAAGAASPDPDSSTVPLADDVGSQPRSTECNDRAAAPPPAAVAPAPPAGAPAATGADALEAVATAPSPAPRAGSRGRVVWGGVRGGRPVGAAAAYLHDDLILGYPRLASVLVAGGGPIAAEELGYAHSRGVPWTYVPCKARRPCANFPYGPVHRWMLKEMAGEEVRLLVQSQGRLSPAD
ncbi:hypothetical protein TSOC_002536 [Tetrabaena socialis]|uniref:Uncharacterized protein n=1 Tax=Tetrabaena socialis TaxID=47790 RepID=A0A2J8ADW8_9CHLO|nr:hypothetical protein TSOC_002536 [Tetrabaena socialis]|eukprot:PNH10696.1 hypothetical protein TSOC_002536 [Tetrabaena socialis]